MRVNSKSRTKKIIAGTWIIPIIVTTPYLYCQSEAYYISSEYGSISRRQCTDRFNEIDKGTGIFRKCYFTILFITMYLIPMIVIIVTCVKIFLCLMQPVILEHSVPALGRDKKHRSEVNKRKVSVKVYYYNIFFN